MAASFMNSKEFIDRFGTEQTISYGQFVNLLYANTLGRAADTAGYDFWIGKLNGGEFSRLDLLIRFSESGENKAGTADSFADGIWYV
jgi:hypothetical protein